MTTSANGLDDFFGSIRSQMQEQMRDLEGRQGALVAELQAVEQSIGMLSGALEALDNPGARPRRPRAAGAGAPRPRADRPHKHRQTASPEKYDAFRTYLREHGGAVARKEIVEALGLNSSAAWGIPKTLEEDGEIRVEPIPGTTNSKRYVLIAREEAPV